MISNEDAKEILDNSPDDTTHYYVNPSNGVNYYLCDGDGWNIFVRNSWSKVNSACGSYVKEINELISQLASEESIANSEEWKNGDIVFIGQKEIGRFVGINPMDINDCFVLSNRDGNAKGYHLSQLSKPLTPAELAAKAREDAISLMPTVPDIESWFWEIDSVKHSDEVRLNVKYKLSAFAEKVKEGLYDAGYRKIGE